MKFETFVLLMVLFALMALSVGMAIFGLFVNVWLFTLGVTFAIVFIVAVVKIIRSSKAEKPSVCPECGRICEGSTPDADQKQEWPVSTCQHCGQIRISVKKPS